MQHQFTIKRRRNSQKIDVFSENDSNLCFNDRFLSIKPDNQASGFISKYLPIFAASFSKKKNKI
jgi:hypothetical protein